MFNIIKKERKREREREKKKQKAIKYHAAIIQVNNLV
jgi:hypothetical protein